MSSDCDSALRQNDAHTSVLHRVTRAKLGFFCAGSLFQYPGFLIAALVGAGVANFLKDPAPWLVGLLSGASASPLFDSVCTTFRFKLWHTLKKANPHACFVAHN